MGEERGGSSGIPNISIIGLVSLFQPAVTPQPFMNIPGKIYDIPIPQFGYPPRNILNIKHATMRDRL